VSFLYRRRAARVVLLDHEDRVLLLRSQDPFDPRRGQWWELPGGGIDPGETSEDAGRREVYEETGLTEIEIGPAVWLQHVEFEFAGRFFDQHEQVHLGRCDGGEIRPARLEALEVDAFIGYRWVPAGELGSLDRVIPPWLAGQLPAVLAGGVPDEPIDLGDQ
jgi:8-oxo-dGTP pyrophosphatase MutT (NUDIX family)